MHRKLTGKQEETKMTEMEKQGAQNGCFNMAKDEGIEACRKYRSRLEAQGLRTYLEYFTGDIFIVKTV